MAARLDGRLLGNIGRRVIRPATDGCDSLTQARSCPRHRQLSKKVLPWQSRRLVSPIDPSRFASLMVVRVSTNAILPPCFRSRCTICKPVHFEPGLCNSANSHPDRPALRPAVRVRRGQRHPGEAMRSYLRAARQGSPRDLCREIDLSCMRR
jgi:hypothetical protein